MKIKVKLNAPGEWSECWLQTQYVGTEDETYRIWLYPTSWSELYRSDGHYMVYYSKSILPDLLQYVKDCEDFLNRKPEINERPLTTMQKISNFFKRVFSW